MPLVQNKRIKAFQGLRGYAIILIFLSHYPFGKNSSGINLTGWFGALGVEIFILLSGYLLMENYSGKPPVFKDYLVKKVKKFYPLHVVMLVAALPFMLDQFNLTRGGYYLSIYCLCNHGFLKILFTFHVMQFPGIFL